MDDPAPPGKAAFDFAQARKASPHRRWRSVNASELRVHGETSVAGITRFSKLAMETCAAVCSATAMNAREAGESGSPMTSGSPLSLPTRMGW
jgi:hypothetical protein